MLLISIDGACRRNGQPDCVSSGGVFIQRYDTDGFVSAAALSDFEVKSTNQRGEMRALLTTLEYIYSDNDKEVQIVTDSEYLFNTMTKEWYKSWASAGWKTSSGSSVKNADLWRDIVDIFEKCVSAGFDIVFYHIKGHCIPFGTVTANRLMISDKTLKTFIKEVEKKYDTVCDTSKKKELDNARKLSIKNNGFELTPDILKRFVVANVIVDAIATRCVDSADALMHKQ